MCIRDRYEVNVYITSNVEESLKILEKKSVDLVISDTNLPRIDGFQFTKMIRTGEINLDKRTPIIIISSTYAGPAAATLAEEAGANAFFYYPFSEDDFRKAVQSIFEPEKLKKEEIYFPLYKRKILVADDDPLIVKMIEITLRKENYEISVARDGEEAINKIKEIKPHLIFLDYIMPKLNGLEVLKWVKRNYPEIIVIMITAYGSEILAVDLMKAGADDYIKKPFSVKNIIKVCENSFKRINFKKLAEQFQEKYKEIELLKKEIQERYSFNNIIGKNYKMRELYSLIEQVACTQVTVLIQGETGTGKELVAKAIHYNSPRKDKPLVVVNCAALPETLLESELFGHEKGAFTGAIEKRIGRFERANGGTLFLDEISEIPPSTQAKLLRAIQEREFERLGGTKTIKVDVRIISSTNRDIEEFVKKGNFRKDLYFRLNVVKITIPPLRERVDDIPILATYFLKKFNSKFKKNIKKFSTSVLRRMMEYSWPGNVRELENVIERAVVITSGNEIKDIDIPEIESEKVSYDFSSFIRTGKAFQELKKDILEKFEKEYITYVLKKFNGNIKLSSEYAQLDRRNFYRKMKEYGIDKEMFK